MTPNNATYTADQLADVARRFPGLVRHIDGQVVALVSREELVALAARYPSHFRAEAPPPSAGDAAEATLAARYPTMFRKQ